MIAARAGIRQGARLNLTASGYRFDDSKGDIGRRGYFRVAPRIRWTGLRSGTSARSRNRTQEYELHHLRAFRHLMNRQRRREPGAARHSRGTNRNHNR